MRVKEMYCLCKKHIQSVKGIKFDKQVVGTNERGVDTVRHICADASSVEQILKNLLVAEPLELCVTQFLTNLELRRYGNSFRLDTSEHEQISRIQATLIERMETIIDIGTSIGLSELSENQEGFDIKLPDDLQLGDISKCLETLNDVFVGSPFVDTEKHSIEFSQIEAGSLWATFIAYGTQAKEAIEIVMACVGLAIGIGKVVKMIKGEKKTIEQLDMDEPIRQELTEQINQKEASAIDELMSSFAAEYARLPSHEEKIAYAHTLKEFSAWIDAGLMIFTPIEKGAELWTIEADGGQTLTFNKAEQLRIEGGAEEAGCPGKADDPQTTAEQ